mgnify:CR=1 FL=1
MAVWKTARTKKKTCRNIEELSYYLFGINGTVQFWGLGNIPLGFSENLEEAGTGCGISTSQGGTYSSYERKEANLE